jgi:hypothetical protein
MSGGNFKSGDRVTVVGEHPWSTHAGTLIAYEKYGLGWMGWRVELDGNCGECYANATDLRKPK